MDGKVFPLRRSDAEWRRILTPAQYDVMRGRGTETPDSCALQHEKRAGRFSCAGCGQPLFESRLKFESGTGWPSFNDPIQRISRLARETLAHHAEEQEERRQALLQIDNLEVVLLRCR